MFFVLLVFWEGITRAASVIVESKVSIESNCAVRAAMVDVDYLSFRGLTCQNQRIILE
jgi:hypothetical protein